MKQIIEMQPDHIYLIRGASTANSPFFESEADCKNFLALADTYLGPYVSILSFQNDRHGWVMIITTKDEATIKTAYKKRRRHPQNATRNANYRRYGGSYLTRCASG